MSTSFIPPVSAATRADRTTGMHLAWLCAAAIGLCFTIPDSAAQTDVHTGASMDSADAMHASMPPEPPEPPTQRVGDATTALLNLQVSGSAAAPVLPMLGVVANHSWQRYLDSFNQPIPVSFNYAVGKTVSGN